MTSLLDQPPEAFALSETARMRPRVLNASSGSLASERATAAAAAIAREHDAELLVLHVDVPGDLRVTRLGPTIVHTRCAKDPYSCAVLLRARRIAWEHGALARVVLMEGEPVSAVLEAVWDLRVELLVIGAQCRRLPASLAARTRGALVRRSPCRVLAVSLDQSALVDRSWSGERVTAGASLC